MFRILVDKFRAAPAWVHLIVWIPIGIVTVVWGMTYNAFFKPTR